MKVSGNDDDYDFDDLAEFDDEPERGSGLAGVVLEALREGDITAKDLIDDLAEFDDDDEAEDGPQGYDRAGEAKAQTPAEPVGTPLSRATSKVSALIAVPATKDSEAIRRPLISGHCAAPQTVHPEESHRRCAGFNRANPDKTFQPCPCACHYPADRYECECGATLAEAPHYPLDEDGDVHYVHVNGKTGRMVDGECPR